MKKLAFHIALCVALFCVLAVIFMLYGKDTLPFYQVEKSSGNSIEITEGADYQCVGIPVGILEKPETVIAGDKIFLSFKGESYTDYSIKVYYPSGLSEAEDFVPVKSDAEGVFGWDFTVSGNTGEGKLRVAVLSDNSYLITEIEIIG